MKALWSVISLSVADHACDSSLYCIYGMPMAFLGVLMVNYRWNSQKDTAERSEVGKKSQNNAGNTIDRRHQTTHLIGNFHDVVACVAVKVNARDSAKQAQRTVIMLPYCSRKYVVWCQSTFKCWPWYTKNVIGRSFPWHDGDDSCLQRVIGWLLIDRKTTRTRGTSTGMVEKTHQYHNTVHAAHQYHNTCCTSLSPILDLQCWLLLSVTLPQSTFAPHVSVNHYMYIWILKVSLICKRGKLHSSCRSQKWRRLAPPLRLTSQFVRHVEFDVRYKFCCSAYIEHFTSEVSGTFFESSSIGVWKNDRAGEEEKSKSQ